SVQCGVVQRALDLAQPEGPKIAVHYVVVPAMARRKLADPVFLLAGGPGQSAIDIAPQLMPLFARLNNRRDIVFVDQRGTGRSAPLDCAEAQRETLAEQSDTERQVALLMRCKTELMQRPALRGPGALGFFTTTIAMGDLDAVRARLGVQRIDLVGVSYGTRAALEYMRQFPAAVRRSVLDSVAPPDMALPASFSTDAQAALDALLAACEREAECRRAHPRLRADWAALLKSLPKAVVAPQPLSGTPERFTLTRDMVLAAVRGALYNPAVAAALPAAISAAAAGRYEALTGIGSLLGSRRGMRLAAGMHFSVVCAEDLPLLDKAIDPPGGDFGDSQARLYRRVCADWPRGAVPSAFYTIPASRTPTLLLSGGLDPATPPRHGARVAQALGAAARQVVVANAGHSVLGIGCARDLLFRFIDAADDAAAAAVDAGCLKNIPRPGVFRPIAGTVEGSK
ncbi:MAG TPA: alpha/beta fold hydrolase, partial [Burkholderiaceae bacterium]|nr:alpha/beta fold hydrolase [Burkholderiaceae bacterium]